MYNYSFSKFLLSILALFILIFLIQCAIEPPTAPKWETSLTIPLINKTFTMEKIVADEKNLSSDSDGNVHFDFEKDLNRYSIDDQLKMKPVNKSFNRDLGSFTIKSPEEKSITFELNDMNNQLAALHGTTGIIPPFGLDLIESKIPEFDEFKWVLIDTGSICLDLKNNLSVYLGPLIKLKIINDNPNYLIQEILIDKEIAPGETYKTRIDISGKKIYNQLSIKMEGQSSGSKNSAVLVNIHSSLDINAHFNSLAIKEALAKIPEQRCKLAESITTKDSTVISEATILSGELSLNFSNNLPLDSKIIYELCDFYNSASQPVIDSLTIPKNSDLVHTISLTNLNLKPEKASIGNQKLLFNWEYITQRNEDFVLIKNSDYVKADIKSSPIIFSEITGVLQEIKIDLTPFSETLKFSEKLDSVVLENAIMELEIENAINLPARSNITVRGTNEIGKYVDLLICETITAAPVQGNEKTVIILNKNNSRLVDFLNLIPEQIEIFGSLKLGDGNSEGIITQTDYIEGKVKISAPLAMSFPVQTATSKVDTLKIKENDRTKIKDNLLSGEVVAIVTNHLPIGASIQANISRTDSTVYSNPDLIIGPLFIEPALTNENGISSDSSTNEISFLLTKENLKIFEDSPIYTGIEITLPGTDGKSIRIMESDFIKIQMYSKFKLSINFDD